MTSEATGDDERRPLRLLLVEDDEDDARLVLRAISRAGFAVESHRVWDQRALDAAMTAHWDAVICDHGLPGFDSLSALRRVHHADADVPFIIVSGSITEDAVVHAMNAGAADYVMKHNLGRLAPALDRELAKSEERARRRRAERELRRLAAIVESSSDAILSKDLGLAVTSWNSAAERMYGWRADEIIGRSIMTIVPEEHRATLRRLDERIKRGAHITEYETVRRRRDGSLIEVSLTFSPIHEEDGAISGISVISRDIGERKRMERQLQHLADHDPLTGLLNRRGLDTVLTRAITSGARYGTPGALLLLDLDNFKYVNDSLGHSAGDQLIRGVAHHLQSRLRQTDVIARVGGDEFVVVLDHADIAQAISVAEDLRRVVRDTTLPGDHDRLRTSVSIGIAPITGEATGEQLLVQADLAMYEAKDRGRDGVALYSAADHDRLTARMTWDERLRAALAHDGFVLHAQPILPLEDGAPSRAELLLRLPGVDGEVHPPSIFLPMAERSDLILEIDRWVLRHALDLMASGALPAHHVEINLSGRSLDDPGLGRHIEAELARTGVDPERVIIELTETIAIANMEQAAHLGRRLRDLGCGFALDDFGTGFGSFYYLKHLPLDYLKIDGDFIRRLPQSETDRTLVRAMVSIARDLDLRTIAEFVEDAATLELLRGFGVDYAQGFHIGRPQPVAAVAPAADLV